MFFDRICSYLWYHFLQERGAACRCILNYDLMTKDASKLLRSLTFILDATDAES